MVEKKVEPKVKGIAQPDKTVLKSTALGGMHGGGAPVFVDVKDGKVVRVRPFHYDWKYKMEEFNPGNSKEMVSDLNSLPRPHLGLSLAYKRELTLPTGSNIL